jgi:glycosyltransferase involved in cell wall biosynthesis
LLWITSEEPNRALGGGNIRQANLLLQLARRVEVDLVNLGPVRDHEVRERVRRVVEVPWERSPEPRSPWRRRIEDLFALLVLRRPFEDRDQRPHRRALAAAWPALGDHDVVLVEDNGLARLAPQRERRRGRWVLVMHTVSSVRSDQTGASMEGARRRWLWRRNAALERRAEAWAGRLYDLVVTVSDDDAAALGYPSTVIPNGVDTTTFVATPRPRVLRLLLSGTLDYPPNVDGALWFCDAVLPAVRAIVPDLEVDIVGRNPVHEVLELGGRDGITVHADVPSIVPFLQQASAAIVPLRIGSGTRLKALEAMAANRPLIGTSIGLAGLGLVDGETAWIADDPVGFADRVVLALTDHERADAVAARALAAVAPFSWDVIGERMMAALFPDAPA